MFADTVLETRELTMRFGGVVAVDRVDFVLKENELRCLIGPNGAGKSTFFKCLTGQLAPTDGRLLIREEHVAGMSPHQIARRGVGIKTQVPSVYDGLTVHENIWLSARRARRRKEANTLTEETIERLQLAEIRRQLVGRLAHGQRQWVEIGIVLARDPWLVLLDEPAAGMTNEEVERTAALVREINRTATLIVVEHDMQFIRMIAEKVTVFHQGAILTEGNMDTVTTDPRVRDVYLGKQGQDTR